MGGGISPAWTVIIVPPMLTRSSRRVGVKLRTVRMLGLLMIAVLAASGLWAVRQTETAAMLADRVAEQQRFVHALHDVIDSLRNVSSVSQAGHARVDAALAMIMPVRGRITSRFSRSRFHPILQIVRAHRGLDLAAPAGTRIVAPASATVVSVRRQFGYGLTIELRHASGVLTRYAHCRTALVKRGDQVAIGQTIALVGRSGLATAPHLHFEVLVRGTAVDPITFLASTHAPVAAAPAARRDETP